MAAEKNQFPSSLTKSVSVITLPAKVTPQKAQLTAVKSSPPSKEVVPANDPPLEVRMVPKTEAENAEAESIEAATIPTTYIIGPANMRHEGQCHDLSPASPGPRGIGCSITTVRGLPQWATLVFP
jgi:hypothetical protein